jgi:hypothetical protein
LLQLIEKVFRIAAELGHYAIHFLGGLLIIGVGCADSGDFWESPRLN